MDEIICYEVVEMNKCGVILKNDYGNVYIDFNECSNNCASKNSREDSKCVATRDITTLSFSFYVTPKVRLVFKKRGIQKLISGKTAVNEFLNFNKKIVGLGYTTYDMS